MESIPSVSSEGKIPAPVPSSSNYSEDDDALYRLISKDPVLGQVMKIIMRKLDETNKKLDCFHNELRSDLDTCQDQVKKLNVCVKPVEDNKATTIETIPTVQVEDLEEKRRQAVENCLGTTAILRRILEQFSDEELISLSLVNKLWNNETRSMLRDRGSLKATIRKSPTCQSLVDFASDLRQMRVIPFNGICLSMNHFGDDRDTCQSFPIGTQLAPAYQDILDRLPWKHLSVGLYQPWGQCKGCPALLLVKKILENKCRVLRNLSISNVDREKAEFFHRIIQSRSFPSLETVKVHEEITDTPLTNGFLKALVACAPNLQEFYIAGRTGFKENVMEGSSKGVLFATSGLFPLNEEICESLIPSLRTRQIDLTCAFRCGIEEKLLKRIIPKLIQASHKKLEALLMDLLFSVPLMCYGICMENVTDLCIWITYKTVGAIRPDVLALMTGFDFTRLFPKLNAVIIADWKNGNFSSNDMSAFLEQGKAVARKASPDRAINIKELKLTYFENATAPLIFLARMFPNVEKLSAHTKFGHEFPIKLLWEHFSCLTELQLTFNAYNSGNLDGVFCGIFPEEAAELGAKDDEYLKAVNIVPVMPSIRCVSGLRLLTIQCRPSDVKRRGDSTWMFSKVTGLIGFHKCPTLSVILEISSNSPGGLDHMKPYVTTVI